MAEGGRLPWSSRRRQARRRRRWNDSESSDNEESEIDRDLLRVVLSDSEDFVPDDVKNTSSVACSCDTDLDDEQPGGTELSNVKNCPNLSDLDPEVRRRSPSFRWLAKKVTRRKNEKDSRKKSSGENRRSDLDENGLGYYARCLQEAKRVREKAELEARNKRMGLTRRRRPLSMISYRSGNSDEESENPRRRRFSLTWGFRRGTGDTNLEEATSDVVDEGENLLPGEEPPSSISQAPREYGRANAISLEELQRRRREKARLKAAQHKLEYFLINDIVSVTNCPWYWGKINRFQAEKVLEGYPDGTFLLRDSAQYHYLFSVSFRRYSRTYHARIEQWKHRYSFDKPSDYSFYSTSVCQLLQHYSRAEQCMYYEPLLLKPLQRRVPPSLQDHCRAAICSRITFQGVSKLPLPNSMKIFLREFHYKIPVKKTEDKGTQTPAPKKRLSSFFHRD